MRGGWIALLLMVPLLTGCFEDAAQEPGGGATPTATSPTPTPNPTTPTPTAPGEEDVPMRTLDEGSQSGVRGPVREVVEDAARWATIWEEHTSRQEPQPDRPTVDFASERIVAIVLEDKPNGCYAARVTNATNTAESVRVVVTTYTPPPDMACASVVTQPFHFVAIPRGPDVTFEERSETGPPGEAS